MLKLVSAIALMTVFHSTQAAGFAPWAAHADAAADTPAMVAAPGFAPWRDGSRVMDAPDAMRIGDVREGAPRAFFSPWS